MPSSLRTGPRGTRAVPEPAAVFDTNVLVSGFLSPHGPPGRIVEWLRQGSVLAVVDDRIAAEYRSVLKRPRFKLPAEEVDLVLDRILSQATWATVPPACPPTSLPGPDDLPFAQCASAAGCPVVTGNRRHFPEGTLSQEVLSPAAFVARITDRATER